MDWIVSFFYPPNSCIEGLTPEVIVFGSRAYQEVIKEIRPIGEHMGRALIPEI